MEVFDVAPMNQSCAARAQTTIARQALALFNGEFARASAARFAARFAARLRAEAGEDAGRQIEHAFQVIFTRPPSGTERAEARRFLREQPDRRAPEATAAVLTDFCHVLLNANEFIHPD